jgi:hypothetical protein
MKLIPLFCAIIFSFSCSDSQAFIPEASGGSKVGSLLVIAGDEEPDAMWIGDDISQVKKTKVQGGKWDDMEGLATLNQKQFFAITSHSLTKKGKRRPEREQLFLMEVSQNTIAVKKTWSLRDVLLTYISKNLSQAVKLDEVITGTSDTGGLNIEGLAYLNNKLYLGLRSPLTKNNEAIMLEISHAETSPVVTGHKVLDLKGNGIRSLETDGDKLIVLSGSQDDSDTSFGLHHFSPEVTSISHLQVRGFSQLLRPESVINEITDSLIFVQDFQENEAQDVLVRLAR